MFKEDGIIQQRAQVLQKAEELLNEIAGWLFPTIEQGKFGGVKRSRTGEGIRRCS